MGEKRLALLIDSENISAKYVSIILERIVQYGVITYKRVYGDWSNTQTFKWREKVHEYALTPIQQFRNTTGKNAIDSALIIDAMDILYTGNVDGFCIVSSDGDFTRLASRLSEAGMMVIGMGEEKSPHSFRMACSIFEELQFESLKEKALKEKVAYKEEVAISKVKEVNYKKNITIAPQVNRLWSKEDVEQAIVRIIMDNLKKGKCTELGGVGSKLIEQNPDFDIKDYGYTKLARFIEEMESVVTIKRNRRVEVKLRLDPDNDERYESIYKYIKSVVGQTQKRGIALSKLGHHLHAKYKQFDVREYGHANLSHFVNSMEGIEIKNLHNSGRREQIVYLEKCI